MSTTPITDAAAKSADRMGDDDVVRVGVARKLEVDNVALRSSLATANRDRDITIAALRALRKRMTELPVPIVKLVDEALAQVGC